MFILEPSAAILLKPLIIIMDIENQKTKDLPVVRILNFEENLTQTQKSVLIYGMLGVPMILLGMLNLAVSSSIVVYVFAVIFASLIALAYSVYLLVNILKKDTGNERMSEIADAIKDGSEGFFAIQYNYIMKLSLVFGFVIFSFYVSRDSTVDEYVSNILGTRIVAFFIVFSFFVGALCSAFSGYIGIWVSVRTNVRLLSKKGGICSYTML